MNTIDKREYFLRAMNAHCYQYKAWVIEAFAFVESLSDPAKVATRTYPYALTRLANGSYTFVDPITGEVTLLEGTFLKGAPFQLMEPIELHADDLPNVHQSLLTCYGNVLVNCVCLLYAFGAKVDFQVGRLTVGKLESLIEKRLVDGAPQGQSDIAIAEFKKFNEAVRHLEGFSQLCVPSATAKTMTVSPAVIKRRDELVAQYKDTLHDPVVQAHIDKELIAMEREWMKGDPGERFYIKDKSYDVVRKRLFLMQGQENGFGKIGEVIPTSLSEGWDVENLPAMVNALRHGSYSRGALTALGGVEAKSNYRIFQNTVVAEEDCGTKLGLRLTLLPGMAKHFISSSVIETDGTVTELTEANVDQYVNKTVTMRTVAYCKTPDQNVCAVCVGKKIAATPNAISTYAADMGSTFLLAFLSAMHGTALKTAKIDYREMLR